MATHIHVHRAPRLLTRYVPNAELGYRGPTTHKTKDCGCGGHDKAKDAPKTGPDRSIPKGTHQFEEFPGTKECAICGKTEPGHATGNARDGAYAQKPTRDAGEPVNTEWLKLDRMSPADLERAANAKSVPVAGKTDTIMGILRATFQPRQIEAWSLHF